MTDPALARKAREGEPGYDPAHPSRVYEHPRATRPVASSITANIDVLSKDGLKFWAAREAAEFAVDRQDEWKNLPPEDAVKLIKSAPFTKTETSPSAIGDLVHDAIDRFIKTGHGEIQDEWPLTAKRMYKSFLAVVRHYKPTWIASEFTVWSRHGYAGTADFACKIGKTVVLADTKSGKKVYPDSVALQLAALRFADVIIEPDGAECEMFKVDRCAVLHVRPTFAKLIPVDASEEVFARFLDAMRLRDWRQGADSLVGDAPKIEWKKEFPEGIAA